MEIGQVCMKIAGRDAGKKCVIIDTIDKNFVLIDGATRRRKCNIAHLEPLQEKVKVKKGASHEEIALALKAIGITVPVKKKKAPKATPEAKPAPKKKAAKTAQTS